MTKKLLLSALMLFALSFFAFGQQAVITGIVTDENGNALPGATIQLKGTTTGVTTDIDGNYSVSVEGIESPVLVFSYVGYLSEEVTISDQTVVDIIMIHDIMAVDEVIFIGYGITKKSLVTGSIAKLDADEIADARPLRIESALQGRSAGVLVQQSSGAPGATQNIIIRGVGSNNAVKPIYVIDGMRTDGIDWLDPADVESMEILKDAASAAIYGTEGGNGVVIITTKRGKEGQSYVTYEGSYGMQSVIPHFDVMETDEYLDYYRIARMNDYGDTYEEATERFPDSDINTDWMEEIYEPAPIQKHKINMAGGTEKAHYYFTFSYTDQDGVIGGNDKSNYTRYVTRLNLDNQATKWLKLGSNISYSHVRSRGISQNDVFGSVTNNAVVLDPTTPVYYADTTGFSELDYDNMRNTWGPYWYTNPGIQDENGYFGISQIVKNEIENPIEQLANDKDQDIINKIFGGIFSDIQFFKGLNLHSNFDIDLSHNYNRGWNPRKYTNSMHSPDLRSRSFQEINMYFTWQWESYLSFDRQFGDLNVGAVLGMSRREYKHERLGGEGRDLSTESDNYAWIDYGNYIDTLNNTSWGSLQGWQRMQSVFGRVSLSYKDKYLLTSNFRQDGSSKFGPANKVKFFPSVSVGWVITREDFWNVEAVSLLKPRFSWGINGTAMSLGDKWDYLPTGTSGQYYYLDGNDQLLPIIEPNRLVNPEYRWEQQYQTDFGVDMAFLRNRITLSVDYYVKKSEGFLFDGLVPILAGNNPPVVNAGVISNKGIELELGFNDNMGDLKYRISFTGSHNRSMVEEMRADEGYYREGGNIGTFGSSKRLEVGYEPWYFYGYETDGLFDTQEEIDNHVNDDGVAYQPNAQLGDVVYLDIAGLPDSLGGGPDGLINASDRTSLGSPYPKFIGGLNINLEYKGFDFVMSTYASVGNKTLLAVSVRDDLPNTNKPDFYLDDAWMSEEDPGNFPRPTVRDRNMNLSRINDYNLQNGSFLRITNITLGYTLPGSLTSRIGMQKLRVYLAVDNLYTFTKYQGMEPEVGGDYWGYEGQQWAGIDRAVYPRPRIITSGINVTF